MNDIYLTDKQISACYQDPIRVGALQILRVPLREGEDRFIFKLIIFLYSPPSLSLFPSAIYASISIFFHLLDQDKSVTNDSNDLNAPSTDDDAAKPNSVAVDNLFFIGELISDYPNKKSK